MLTAQELVVRLTEVIKSHGPDIRIEVRNFAGDLDYPDSAECVQVAANWYGEPVIRIETSAMD